ncbi:MAG: hypothetical protein ABSD31_05770, partial [Candidatus Binataceae bacterium]
MKTLLAAVTVMALTGCSSLWTQINPPPSETQMSADCTANANAIACPMLVSRFGNKFSVLDAASDLSRALGPGERPRVLVPVFQEPSN